MGVCVLVRLYMDEENEENEAVSRCNEVNHMLCHDIETPYGNTNDQKGNKNVAKTSRRHRKRVDQKRTHGKQ